MERGHNLITPAIGTITRKARKMDEQSYMKNASELSVATLTLAHCETETPTSPKSASSLLVVTGPGWSDWLVRQSNHRATQLPGHVGCHIEWKNRSWLKSPSQSCKTYEKQVISTKAPFLQDHEFCKWFQTCRLVEYDALHPKPP